MNARELRSQRNEVLQQALGVIEKAEKENRDLNADEETLHADLLSQAESLLKRAERLEKMAGVIPNASAAPTGERVEVTRDASDQPWSHSGEFFKAVRTAAVSGYVDQRLLASRATGMSEGVPADGGYLVPPQTAAGLVERMYDTSQILSRVSSDPVSGNSMDYNAVDESTHVGSMYGGIVGYWVAEGATITASKPKFGQVGLKLKEVAALCYATNDQLEDTPALASWLNRTVPNVLRFYVEDAIVNGSGVGKPLGIMQSPCLVTSNRDTTAHIYLADLANMWTRRWTGVSDYVWLVSATAMAQLLQLTAATAPIWMPPGGVANSPFGSIYGRPVIETEYCQALNTTGDIILASLSQYQTIQKGGVNSASSIHVAFTTNEMAFRFTYRIDGSPLWNSALTTLYGSTNTVSPFVCLVSAST